MYEVTPLPVIGGTLGMSAMGISWNGPPAEHGATYRRIERAYSGRVGLGAAQQALNLGHVLARSGWLGALSEWFRPGTSSLTSAIWDLAYQGRETRLAFGNDVLTFRRGATGVELELNGERTPFAINSLRLVLTGIATVTR